MSPDKLRFIAIREYAHSQDITTLRREADQQLRRRRLRAKLALAAGVVVAHGNTTKAHSLPWVARQEAGVDRASRRTSAIRTLQMTQRRSFEKALRELHEAQTQENHHE